MVKKRKYIRKRKSKPEEMTITHVSSGSFRVGDKVYAAPTAMPDYVPPKTFYDCIFEIVNSNMDQNTKTMAFGALAEASKTNMR